MDGYYGHHNPVEAAIRVIDSEARRQLLSQIPDEYGFDEFVVHLVGENLDLYKDLLNNKHLKRYQLVPLSGHPEGGWIDKDKLALDAVYVTATNGTTAKSLLCITELRQGAARVSGP